MNLDLVMERTRFAGRRSWAWAHEHRRSLLLGAAAALALFLLLRAIVPPAVDVVQVEPRPIVETLVTTGRVRNVSRAGVGAPVGGSVTRVLVREGTRVEAGQLLVQLEDAEAVAAARSARAQLAEAEAALGRVSGVDLPSSTAELQAAQLEASQRAADVERARTLLAAGAISETELEETQRLAETARARLAVALSAMRSASDGGPGRRAAEAAVAAARGAVEAADARAEQTRVRAPAAGIILTRDVEPGDVVTPGTVLMNLSLDGPTELLVSPDERVLEDLRPGLPAIASADAYPDRRFDARVHHVAPLVDTLQGTVEVRLRVPDPPPYLLPNMTVSVNIDLARRAAASSLPLAAVRSPLSDAPWVMLARDGRAVPAVVALGVRDTEYVEIVRGLAPDDVVILDPAEVSPGDRVRVRR